VRGILKYENRLRHPVLALSACMAVRFSQKHVCPSKKQRLWHARWAESGNFHESGCLSIDVFSHGITDARSFHVISTVDFSTDINFGHKREYLYFSGEELKELIMMQFFL
jgi:hypothetical protein